MAAPDRLDPHFVVDTNVFISSIISPTSKPSTAIDRAYSLGDVLYSTATLEELRTVLVRPYFKRYVTSYEIDEILAATAARGVAIEVVFSTTDCRDPKDNKFLELALDGGAGTIISGDQDLLVLHPWRGIDILTPKDFLAAHPEL